MTLFCPPRREGVLDARGGEGLVTLGAGDDHVAGVEDGRGNVRHAGRRVDPETRARAHRHRDVAFIQIGFNPGFFFVHQS